ncbi:biotin/lipoyl-binding carrier protein [Aeromicrobium sp. 636]|uniref:Biotin/lipoyl-binding carrier protein n=1 Tax=Aeromicrobium senzhongii TaxID=2663859 RepID=A0A8I0EUD4_9ACTN|nr:MULTISPECIES: biotin/lipoyl-binding carrier protein [Aeromicrobium]MBC9226304.1 biotin/lipoyl-binding carrier protein [Aeromicrobium senzhongii]MCQ3998410.1 biotin/lipoyl-binding carrier protein [Aeromicrobium sp. 636]MTB88839.1 biotin/lipoyl-binding carrier protein [Aeromicrobium senzhongii]QNL93873.1 biotin/lipoyl-binding carrier protein [Aeromicrobium senzhongii]
MINAKAEIVGNVWKILAREGDQVGPGDPLVIMETMKMEIPVVSPVHGHVAGILVSEGQIVQEGDAVVEIDDTVGA